MAAAAGREGAPSKLVFVVTKRCYSRCVYCDIWKAKDIPGALDAELTLPEIRAIAQANSFLQWVDFTGGEPTDRPDFVEVVQSFAEACPDLLLVHFPTNGIATARIREVVAQLQRTVKARLVVTVSIDGPPELNDRLRGIRNDFAHAIESFAAVRALLGPANAFVGMTLHAHKASCGSTTMELVAATFAAINAALAQRGEAPMGWGAFHLNIPHLSQHYYANQANAGREGFGGPVHRAEVAAALEFAATQARTGSEWIARTVERIYRVEAQRYLATGRTAIVCSALLSTAYLSEKGEVYPCTIWDKPLGNVRQTGYALLPLVEQARQNGVRRAIATRKCPNCWTPCEAHPAILASPLRSALALSGLR
ncbi:MAG: radical SAM protein [Opitutaceae bacterium]|nr:radical SAM protein [Opitutaceae bacterium]